VSIFNSFSLWGIFDINLFSFKYVHLFVCACVLCPCSCSSCINMKMDMYMHCNKVRCRMSYFIDKFNFIHDNMLDSELFSLISDIISDIRYKSQLAIVHQGY
jgi:hypothetical protein